jgi:hypothetical protein
MFHLSFEVIGLFGGGNPTVDDVVPRVARFRVVFGFFKEVREVVLPMSATCSNGLNFALRFPVAEGGEADSELLGNFGT